MRSFLIAAIMLLAGSWSGIAGAQESTTGTDSPAKTQLNRWLSAFNSGDRAEIERFLASDYPARLPKLANEMANRARSGGYDLRKVEGSTDTTVTGLVQQRDSDEFVKFTLEVEPAPPHKIASIKLLLVPRPAEFAIPRMSEADAVRELQALVQKRVASDQFSGTLLLAKRDKVLYQAAFGLADRARKIPNELDTRFRLGSMNKMFTGVAILQLVQAGKVKLDAPLGQYVADYPNADIARKVTIHQLPTHTGGTGDIFGPEFTANRLQLKTLDDHVKLYGKRALGFEPGSKFEYSNYGYILLGVVIERVSGKSYYDYIDEHVYRVARMRSSGSLAEDEIVSRRSIGYTRQLNIEEWRPNTDTLPYRGTSAGGGYSTAVDLLRFANALLDHELLDARHTRLLINGKVDGPFDQYAYGFGDTRSSGGGWSGSGWVGHSGGAMGMNGDLLIYPEDGYIVVALANIDPPAASTVSQFVGARLPLQQASEQAAILTVVDRFMDAAALCVEEAAVKNCFEPSASIEQCRTFVREIEGSPDVQERSCKLAQGAALGALADRTDDAAESKESRRRQRQLYTDLVAANPNDTQALTGLAGIAATREERIALLRRVVAADPRDSIAARVLSAALLQGTSAEQSEATRHMQQAYVNARPPHRWFLAKELYDQYLFLGRKDDAAILRQKVVADIDVKGARRRLEDSLREPSITGSSDGFEAIETLCNANTIYIVGSQPCLDGLDQISAALSKSASSVAADRIDMFARAARTAFDRALAENDSRAERSIRESLRRLRSAGAETALLLQVEAHFASNDPDRSDQDSLELLRRATALAPQDGNARLALGRYYLDHDRVRDAIGELELAAALLPDHQKDAARMNLILALQRDGQHEKAKAMQREIGSK